MAIASQKLTTARWSFIEICRDQWSSLLLWTNDKLWWGKNTIRLTSQTGVSYDKTLCPYYQVVKSFLWGFWFEGWKSKTYILKVLCLEWLNLWTKFKHLSKVTRKKMHILHNIWKGRTIFTTGIPMSLFVGSTDPAVSSVHKNKNMNKWILST